MRVFYFITSGYAFVWPLADGMTYAGSLSGTDSVWIVPGTITE
jgi:hypothetical protein